MLSNIKTRASFALVLVGLIWGYAFVVMKNELDFFSVFNLLFWRFLIAFVFLSIFYGFSSGKKDSLQGLFCSWVTYFKPLV